jgi:O-antigen/teichoic acid export membrane protein
VVEGAKGGEVVDNGGGASLLSGRELAFGAIASAAVNFVKLGLQLLMLPLMARLLGPEEFGIYALALPTISIATLLADGGLGSTLAREPESSTLVWSSAFWLLLTAGTVFALGASAFGFLLAHLVDQPRIAPMIAWLSLSLIFLVLSVPPAARLFRRKHLGLGAAADLAAALVGVVVAVVLAAQGAGAWSLVGQYLATFAARAIVLNLSAFEMPQFMFSVSSIRSYMASGGLLIGLRFSEYLGRMGENVLVDWIFGSALLGSFTFANQVSRFSTESVSNVTWSTIYVQALTSERTDVADLHRRLCRMLAGMLLPTTFLAAAAAPELIRELLGPKWGDLAPMLRILLPVSALSVIGAQVGPILLAIDRFNVFFWCALGLAIGRIVAIGFGWWTGMTGMIVGIGGITLLHFVTLVVLAASSIGYRIVPMLRDLIGPAVSGLIAAASCRMMLDMLSLGPWPVLFALIGGFAVFVVCIIVIDRKGLEEDWDVIRRLVSAPRFAVGSTSV